MTNTHKRCLAIFLFIIAGAIILVSCLSPLWLPAKGYHHTGKVLFNNASQYQNFKTIMSSPDITIKDLAVLNSDYPKLITFKFISSDNTPLYQETVNTIPTAYYIPCMLLSIIPGVIGICIWPKQRKDDSDKS